MTVAVVVPAQFGAVHPMQQHVYARRRLAVGLLLITTVLVLFFGAGHVVANRGGDPASASTVRPATHAYIVRSGDTLWSIGERFHGDAALVDYVDALVAVNGGTRLQVSQALTLP
jgi:nucleoid-associated protein YgaU